MNILGCTNEEWEKFKTEEQSNMRAMFIALTSHFKNEMETDFKSNAMHQESVAIRGSDKVLMLDLDIDKKVVGMKIE